MKKLWIVLLFSSVAQAAYSPGVFIADPSTPTQRAAVDASGNLSVKAASLPLPTGASTSANQSTMITDLGNISGQLPATLGQKTMANSLACTLASDQSSIPVTGTFWQATQPVSIASAISTKAPVNTNGNFQQASVSTTGSTLSAPANAVAFVLEADSGNTDCIRWTITNAGSSTSGMKLEPGRDTGEIHVDASVGVYACSSTQTVMLQWILSQ